MDLLKAVNLILPALGEHVVTRVDVRHPTLAVILPQIDTKLDETLMRGWWFNEGPITLYPDTVGNIFLPTNTLAFLPDDTAIKAAVRGNKLYNMTDRNFVFPTAVTGNLMERLLFEELPDSVATYIFYTALVQIYIVDLGLESVVGEWQKVAAGAEATATQEHLRNKRFTTRKSRKYRRFVSALRG